MNLRSVQSGDGPVTVGADGADDPASWIGRYGGDLRALLHEHGAVLVTGLGVRSAQALAEVRDAFGAKPADLREQFAARSEFGAGVYSSPEWAPDREMCLHHEQSYAVTFPGLLLMACVSTPDTGGATLLGDTRQVIEHLPAELVSRFREQGWLLVRNFRPYFGLSWSDAYGHDTPTAVEHYCAVNVIGCQWQRDGTLHTAQRRAAIVRHPVTGQECWFNQIAFFSQWSIDVTERDILLKTFGPSGIPFNTAYGNGETFSADEFTSLLDGYDAVLRRVQWEAGDLLLVDNLLTAHGREPYTGDREILVALADPVELNQCVPTVPALPGPAQ